MYLTSSAERRVLMPTSGTPAHGTPKCASSITWVFGARIATGLPAASGTSAPASR